MDESFRASIDRSFDSVQMLINIIEDMQEDGFLPQNLIKHLEAEDFDNESTILYVVDFSKKEVISTTKI